MIYVTKFYYEIKHVSSTGTKEKKKKHLLMTNANNICTHIIQTITYLRQKTSAWSRQSQRWSYVVTTYKKKSIIHNARNSLTQWYVKQKH